MFKSRLVILIAAAGLSFSFAACGGSGSRDDGGTDCIECGAYGGGAVRCWLPLGNHQDICAADQSLAAFSCSSYGGTWQAFDVCAASLETGDDPGNFGWDPGSNVTFDRESGTYIIDRLAFEQIKHDPTPLLDDSSSLRENNEGNFVVAEVGEIADALGWQAGDVLLALNGNSLEGVSSIVDAYEALSNETEFRLEVQRDQAPVTLRYRVQ